MKPHYQLTILRNLHRVRELRTFRAHVERYFERSERDVNDEPLDWPGAQAARSSINELLPRVIQMVHAAGLGEAIEDSATPVPGYGLGRIHVLQQIFSIPGGGSQEQEIYDLLDMAIGVYQGGRLAALLRTINPLHYAATLLAFLARAPRRMVAALGFGPRPRQLGPGTAELARLESGQARRNAEFSQQLAELAERLDFAERLLAQERSPQRSDTSTESDVNTPV